MAKLHIIYKYNLPIKTLKYTDTSKLNAHQKLQIHINRWKINIASNTQKLVYQKLLHITRYTPHTCTKQTPDSLTIIHLLHPLTSTPTPTHTLHLTSLLLTTLCIHTKLHSIYNQTPPHPPPHTHPPLYPHPFTIKLICTYLKSRRPTFCTRCFV